MSSVKLQGSRRTEEDLCFFGRKTNLGVREKLLGKGAAVEEKKRKRTNDYTKSEEET